ncbi:FimV/HubP family polar landmark protein [Methyloradius palustris]|nr:FimV/HubP family polar landmark protein [Methyloradius palustris]
MSLGAEAAGLGKLTVLSGLGEPLNAEIELLAAGPDELSSLSAIIAPEEAYKVQGIERPALHSTIKIEIKKSPSGSAYLKLSSNLPVSDPYLDMLIQVDWSSGRLLREYTLLLDPPGYSQPPVSLPSASKPTISKPVVVSPASMADAPVATSSSKPAKGAKKNSAASAAPVATQADAPPSDESKVTTAKGDTLYSIARNANVQNVSLDQVLVGIYQANKDAFIGNNMNRLKVGQIIRVPSSTELAAIPKAEAAQEIKVQSSDFQSYRNKLAGTVEAAPAMSDDEGKKSSGGKITKAAEDKATPVPTAPKDVVKLSKGVSADTKVLQDKVTGLQEEATAKEKTIKESNDRVAALEKQVADMQKLLVMKNQAMADAQKNAAANAPSPALPSKPEATPVPTPAAPVVAEQPAPAPVEAPKPAVPAEAEKPVDTTPAAVPAPEKKPVPVKKFTPPPPPVEEPGLFDDVNLPLVGGAGGFLALLVGGWLFLRNKRRRSLDGFEKDILTSGGLKANTVFGNTLGGTVDSGDTSFLTDFSPGTGMIDTHDVDPIAEAEVYMAYGRDSQAEEILKDAIVKEPKRYELHLKLLEMYAARKDSSAFETVAGELYSTLGTTDPTWAKVATLGRSFEPDNPLYEATEVSESQELGVSTAVAAGLVASEVAVASELAEDTTLDFSLDSPETDSAETSADAVEDNVLDFDIGTPSAEAEAIAESHASTMEMQASKAEEDFSSDAFDLDIGEPAEKPAESNDDLDFQLDLPEDAATDTVQLDMASFAPETSLDIASDVVEEPSLDFDKTMVLGVPDLVEAESSPEIDFSANQISFDLPEIKEAEPEVQSIDVSAETLDLPEIAEVSEPLELSVPDFEKTTITSLDANEIDSSEINFSSAEQDQAFDLDLDVDFANLETEEITVSELAESEPATVEDIAVPEIDLSGISLDLDAAPELSDAIASSESSEVDTKLDLVTAYMDMGDNEGARELLDEVLKEGGVQQRLKAQEILKSLS